MFKKIVIALGLIVILLIITSSVFFKNTSKNVTDNISGQIEEGGIIDSINPLSIKQLRENDYPGSEIVIERELDNGSNYKRYTASYKSEGLKIYGLLTIPNGNPSTGSGQRKPKNGWPAIIFNHGYIAPREYRTTERYVAYVDGFARNGYVVFKSDYRGHGNSEGQPTGAYGSNSYTIDVLNAVSSVKKLKDVNPNLIGMWGHSLGGYLTLRSMVSKNDIKAGVIWAGVVASYPDLLTRWRRNRPTPSIPPEARGWRKTFIDRFGDPKANPDFWNSISANSYLADISGPIQLHHGTSDESVPVEFSQTLEKQMKEAGKYAELYTYPGDDHNLSLYLNTAMQRSIEFFDKYLKD